MKRPPARIARVLLIAVSLSACTRGVGNYFAPTAAVVEGRKIPESLISAQLARAIVDPEFAPLFQGPRARENRLNAQREILTSLIHDEVLSQAAGTLGVSISTSDVTSRLEDLRSQFQSEQAFQEQIDRLRLNVEQLEYLVRREILIGRVEEAIGRQVEVTEDQIAQHYEQNKAQYEGQIRASHILVCANINEITRVCNAAPEDEQQAKDIAQRARAGEDFASLASQFSKDSVTASSGGDLGWFGRSRFVVEFEERAFAMQPGEISDPVRSQVGWHVINLTGKGRPLTEARGEIEEQLTGARRQTMFQDFLRDSLQRAAPRIRINPKFGRFDRTTLTVVPGE